MNLQNLMSRHEENIIALRRQIHSQPELSFQEENTSRLVSEELERLGIPFVRLKEHCVVGCIVGHKAGKKLALRADMDALPVLEETGLPFASRQSGKMHACGHDGHTAMLLGAAAMLMEQQENLRGTVYLCFQSAEEVGGGAQVIVDYLMEQGGVDQAIALHVWPDLDSGSIALDPGARMASIDGFTITIRGQGGHASRPDLARDPIQPLCALVLALSTIPGKRVSPLEPCVVHIGQIEGGSAPNIFPETASLSGGIRSFSEDTRLQVKEWVKETAKAVAQAHGTSAQVHFKPGVGMVYNDEQAVAFARSLLQDGSLLQLKSSQPLTASENFGLFTEQFTGFMAYLGIKNQEKGLVHTLHHPKFDLDEAVLAKGAAFFALYAKAYLAESPG